MMPDVRPGPSDCVRVGIDVKTLALHGAGISASLLAVLPGLLERTPGADWIAFGPAEALRQLPAGIRGVQVELMRSVGGIRLPLYDQVQLPLAIRRSRVRLFYSPYFDAPILTGVPTIVTMYDAVHLRFPELYPRAQRLYYRSLMRLHGARAAAVITVSEFSRNELMALAGVDPARLHVVPTVLTEPFRRPPGRGNPAVPARRGLPGRYGLYTGGVEPRKNLSRLFAAWASWKRIRPGLPALVLTGDVRRYEAFRPEIDRLGLREDVSFTGRLSGDDLVRVYAGSLFVVYPSLYEGFGLPVLEAMATGVPIVCSNRGSLPEIGGDAAIYFDPESPDDIVRALDAVVMDTALVARLVAAGRERVAQYSPEVAAQKLAAVLLGVLAAA